MPCITNIIQCPDDNGGNGGGPDISSIVTTDNLQMIPQLTLLNLFGQPIESLSTVVTDNNGEVVTQP